MARFTAVLAAIAVVVVGLPDWAIAHTALSRAEPRPGSTLSIAPEEVRLWMTSDVLPAATSVKDLTARSPAVPSVSEVRVLDSTGRRVDMGDTAIDPADKKQIRVSLPRLPPGIYKVVWRVIAADEHELQGEFTYTILHTSRPTRP